MKKVAIIQSNYIPWKGYFDIINDVDLFIFYDDVQFTKRDWRNRNKVKTNQGTLWVTIPVGENTNRLICEVEIKDVKWQQKHYKIFEHYYKKAIFYKQYIDLLKHLYLERPWKNLSELNQYTVELISKEFLNINTIFENAKIYHTTTKKQERIIELLKKVNASTYISGPLAKDYLEEQRFRQERIELVWKDYSGYPEYPQFYPPFEHGVTILDLLFHTGPDAPYYIWGWREQ